MTADVFADTRKVPRHGGDQRPHIILPDHAPNTAIADALDKPYARRTAAERRLLKDRVDYYTRASTLAKALDDGDGLLKWKAAMTLLGAAKSPTVVKAASVITDWHECAELVEQCCTLAGADDKRTEGTTLHKLTEFIDNGTPLPAGLDDATLASLEAYRKATAGLKVLSAETFVVNDELSTAGTFDRLYEVGPLWPEWLRGKTVVGDLKTGSFYPQSCCIQLATYAGGALYNPADGSRTPLGAAKGVGLVMHMPQGKARCDIYALDLTAGRRAAGLARAVKTWNSAVNRDLVATLVAEVAA